MSYNIHINSYTRGVRDILEIPVSRAVQIKYDNMVRHNLYLALTCHGRDQVQLGVVSEGILLDQDICGYTPEAITSAVQDLVDDADIPKLLKLKKINAEATVLTGRVQ